MPLLCLDTSTRHLVAAVVDPASGDLRGAIGSGRAQTLLELVDELFPTAEERGSIVAIVVGIGPGGFTGLRVGVATARGLAEALRVPLYGVSSLAVVAAATATARPGDTVWAKIDAKRGEHFVQPYVANAEGVVTATQEARAMANADVDVLEGIVVDDEQQALVASLAIAALQTFDAAQVATGDSDGDGDGNGDGDGEGAASGDPLTVLPDYVRGPDAEPPRMEVRFDQLVAADLGTLDVIERRCFPHPWSPAMYAEELRRTPESGVHLAARDHTHGGRLVGAALAARIGDSWHIMNVLVDPAARRRGIAARLVEELLRQTELIGAGDVGEGWTLEVRAGNVGAIALYESFGFVNHGTRPGYYIDTGEDALIMWRTPQSSLEGTQTAARPMLEDVTL